MAKWTPLPLVLVLLAGCGQPAVETPEVGLLNLGQIQFQGLGGTAVLRLRLGNPNADPVVLQGVRVRLLANGSKFCKGMTGIDKPIPPYEHLEVDVPASLSNLALIRAAASSAMSGKIQYRMQTTLTFEDHEGTRHTRTETKNGDLDAGVLKR